MNEGDQQKINNINKYLYVAALIGLGISVYLSYVKLTSGEYICGISSCGVVNNSEYSMIFGIPIAYLGLLFYGGFIVFLKFGNPILILLSSIVGVLFSIYFTYLEAFVIHAWCEWCVMSAWITVVLLILSIRLYKLKTSKPPVPVTNE